MALTFTKVKHNTFPNGRCHIYDVTFDNSYPTAGEAVTASNFGLTTINGVNAIFSGATAANGRIITFNPTTSKLLVWTAPATEAVDTSDQSAVTARVHVWGERI